MGVGGLKGVYDSEMETEGINTSDGNSYCRQCNLVFLVVSKQWPL